MLGKILYEPCSSESSGYGDRTSPYFQGVRQFRPADNRGIRAVTPIPSGVYGPWPWKSWSDRDFLLNSIKSATIRVLPDIEIIIDRIRSYAVAVSRSHAPRGNAGRTLRVPPWKGAPAGHSHAERGNEVRCVTR